jgi:hypothetical protein
MNFNTILLLLILGVLAFGASAIFTPLAVVIGIAAGGLGVIWVCAHTIDVIQEMRKRREPGTPVVGNTVKAEVRAYSLRERLVGVFILFAYVGVAWYVLRLFLAAEQ